MSRGRNAVRWVAFCWLLARPFSTAYGLERGLGLGLRPPTPQEKARFEAVSTPVTSLQPNALAMARYRAEVETARRQGKAVTASVGTPSAVDNSTFPSFPPIRSQGGQGSCAAWATAYYYSTYTQAQEEGYTVSTGDNTHICSPGFMYNLIDYGRDSGSSIQYAMLKLRDVGCGNWASKPYLDSDYSSWPSETAWVSALQNRTLDPRTIAANVAAGVTAVKQHLANGNVGVIGLQLYSTWYDDDDLSDAVGINNGVYYARDGSTVGGHAVTLIGYDDNRSYVDHRDGQTHYGAFLVANSWGTGWGVRNSTGLGSKGYFWIAYTMFLDGTLWYYGDHNVYYNDDRPHYRPTFYAVVGVNHASRQQLSLNCAIGSWQSQYALVNDGGVYPVSDTACIAVDMTDGVGSIGSPPISVAARLEVSSAATSNATITRADFYEDLDGNGAFAVHSSPDPTVTVTPGSVGLATLSLVPSAGQDCDVTSTQVPSAVTWDSDTVCTVTVRNLGAGTWTPGLGYQLIQQDPVDRWAVGTSPVNATVATNDSCDIAFDLIAPPVSTVAYTPPVSDTAPGVLSTLPLSLAMAQDATLLNDGLFSQNISVSRFVDIQPGAAGAWARFYVEECAGRVPPVVGGYPDGSYRPTNQVTRDQMAVFMQRALELPLASYTGGFTDVLTGYWAANQIQTLRDSGVVDGYSDGTYRPAQVVTRDAMAVFVARGLAGGDSGVPPGPGTATFSDVPTGYWAFKYVQYAATHGVVGGYGDGTYRPITAVTRDQMAVFVYRAFVQSGGAAVVLAGPAVTAVDPASGGACGWASAASGAVANPGYAYLAFDAVRLDPSLASGGTWDVTLELRQAASPAVPATGSYITTVSLSGSQLTDLRDAAKASGNAHYVVTWALPADLAAGGYLLVVSVEDDTGVVRELARKSAFTITP